MKASSGIEFGTGRRAAAANFGAASYSRGAFPRGVKAFAAALLVCFASCGVPDAGRTAGGNNARAAATAQDARPATTPTPAQPSPQPSAASEREGVLIDYRRQHTDNAPPSLDAGLRRRIIASAVGPAAAPDDYTINGSASGSFTALGARETVYLIERGGPVASDPNGAQDLTLAVFDEAGKLVAKFETSDFNFIAATADTDGDGVGELLLEGSFLNMGTLGSSARLVSLKSGRLRAVRDFEGVYENPCEGGGDAPQVTAAVISHAHAADGNPPSFTVTFYRAPCPVGGGDPNFESFKPAPANAAR
ncbi:MAG TPA: hypothetical protein VM936_18510 [Pyrinomonadaceae bacterium]|nr:hypothetical protein [Pyrinomonadaceae bacterium]